MFFSRNVYLQEVNIMASNSNKKLVPEAMTALDKFKYEVASDDAVKKIFKIFLTLFSSEATSFLFKKLSCFCNLQLPLLLLFWFLFVQLMLIR